MPLIKKASKKAFEHNVKAEMKAHPDERARNLAIAYSVKRKAQRKRMADGGSVEITAKDERRPMPDQEFADRLQASAVRTSDTDQDLRKERQASADDAWDRLSRPQSSKARRSDTDQDLRRERMSDVDEDQDRLSQPQEDDMIHDDPDSINRHHDEDIEDARLMARGGKVSPYEAEMEHEHEEDMLEEEHEDEEPMSMADAIRKSKMWEGGMYSDGGEVDLEENAREHHNEEDELSFDALRKENYSESDMLDTEQPEDSNEHGHSLDDEHDLSMIDEIRRRMRMRRR